MSRTGEPTDRIHRECGSRFEGRTLGLAVAALIAAAGCEQARRPISGPASFRGFDVDSSAPPDAPVDAAVDGPAPPADALTASRDAPRKRDAGPPDAFGSDTADATPPRDLSPVRDVPVADLSVDKGPAGADRRPDLPADVARDAGPPDVPVDAAPDVAVPEPDTALPVDVDLARDLAPDVAPDTRAIDLAADTSPPDATADTGGCTTHAGCSTSSFCSGGRCVSDVVHVAAGEAHTCAIHADQKVTCWGRNSSGQLGTGRTSLQELRPVAVKDLPPVKKLALGAEFSCALAIDGRVFCWGANLEGMLGDGSRVSRATPGPVVAVTAPGDLEDVSGIAASTCHVCAVASFHIVCWGCNSASLLGKSASDLPRSTTPIDMPATVGAKVIGSGGWNTLFSDGVSNRCGWGDNQFYQLIYGHGEYIVAPPVCEPLADVAEQTAGTQYTCARTKAGLLYCWGTMRDVASIRTTRIVSGPEHLCLVPQDGSRRVLCRGINTDGQLGDGMTGVGRIDLLPVLTRDRSELVGAKPDGLGSGSVADHTCAILEDGSLHCWGRNDSGQIGDGTTSTAPLATPVQF